MSDWNSTGFLIEAYEIDLRRIRSDTVRFDDDYPDKWCAIMHVHPKEGPPRVISAWADNPKEAVSNVVYKSKQLAYEGPYSGIEVNIHREHEQQWIITHNLPNTKGDGKFFNFYCSKESAITAATQHGLIIKSIEE